MRTKSWILMAVALGCGLVASVAISQVVSEQKKHTTETPMVEILIAVKDIEAASKFTKENLHLEKWPKDRVPSGAIADFKDIDGKFANQSIFKGEPIVKKKTIDSTVGLSNIPAGFLIFDMEVNDKNGGKFVKPGDRVDILGFFEKTGKLAETKTMVIVENVTVKAVDGNAVRDGGDSAGKTSKTIQLMVRSTQYEALNTAANVGKLRVAIRPLDDDNPTSENTNGDAFLAWVKTMDETGNPREGSSPMTPIVQTPIDTAPPKASDEPVEMLVITPSGHSKFRWKNRSDKGLPELVDTSSNRSRSSKPPRGELVSGVNATNPGSGNMVWNPASGQWTTSGFTPSYPDSEGADVGASGDEDVESASDGE